MSPHEIAARAKKVLALVSVIDEAALKQKRSPFDQAGLILLASYEWVEAVWVGIAYKAGCNPPSEITKDAVRDVYRGRATAPVERKAS